MAITWLSLNAICNEDTAYNGKMVLFDILHDIFNTKRKTQKSNVNNVVLSEF